MDTTEQVTCWRISEGDRCTKLATYFCEANGIYSCDLHQRSCCHPIQDAKAKPTSVLADAVKAVEGTQDFKNVIDGQGVKSVMKEMKCPLELIPPQFSEGVAEILKFGAKKYAPNNWMRGMSWETVAGGMARHLSAFRRGEEMDPESNLPHLFHLACGAMFLSYYAHGPAAGEYRKFDDRKYTGKVAK